MNDSFLSSGVVNDSFMTSPRRVAWRGAGLGPGERLRLELALLAERALPGRDWRDVWNDSFLSSGVVNDSFMTSHPEWPGPGRGDWPWGRDHAGPKLPA